MRHIFILNPAAGKSQSALALRPSIEAFFEQYPMEYNVYVTERRDHATEIVKRELEKGDEVRFYACGGDGTVLEVVNGLVHLLPKSQHLVSRCTGQGDKATSTCKEASGSQYF